MLSTLVDNSTLTAIQRLIGDVPVALSFAVEGDVSAYDQYLQSLLIYDELAAIDDYKEEFKIERKDSFKEIRFINPQSVSYTQATELASAMVDDINYEFKRGELNPGPMADFLRTIDLTVLPAWYMQSSEWFLSLRILADESDVSAQKYGALMNAIQSQTSQINRSTANIESKLIIQTRDGDYLDQDSKGNHSVTSEIKKFSAGLSWIAQRTAFYLYLAEKLECAFTIHPIRHAFAGQYILNRLRPSVDANIRKGALDFFVSGAESVRSASDLIIQSAGLGVRLPFFAAWAVGYAGNPKNGYDHVLQIRHDKEALALRSRFREIEEMAQAPDQSELRRQSAKLIAAVANDIQELRKRFSAHSKPDPIDVSVDLLSLSPSISLKGVLGNLTSALPLKSRKPTTLLRNISRDFMMIPSMGIISDRFYRSRVIKKGTEFIPDITRIESTKWKNTSSSWKRPL